MKEVILLKLHSFLYAAEPSHLWSVVKNKVLMKVLMYPKYIGIIIHYDLEIK